MALTIQLGALVTLCKQRCDKENDAHIGDANGEWKSLITELYGEMHKLVSEPGARYFEAEQTITANGAASYALPADYLSTVGIDFVLDSAGRRRPLDELMVQERVDFYGITGEAFGYELSAQTIVLRPTPATGTYKHVYLPQPTDYSTAIDATNVDLINIDGRKFIVWGVAAIALHKSESAQQRAMVERDKAAESLAYWAHLRSLNNPKRRVNGDGLSYIGDPADFQMSRP